MHGRYVSDIMKMCMKKINAKNLFFTNLQGFDLHIAGGILACLQPISCCICENKDADQCLCFRYTDSTIPLLPIYEISSL